MAEQAQERKRSEPRENSIRPALPRARPAEALRPPPATNASRTPDNPAPLASTDMRADRPTPPAVPVVPEQIRKQFVQVGRKYYFADGARAFTDRGRRLTTPSENTEVIRSLIVIAQARGWADIAVTGTDRFRKEAWFAAKMAGLSVRGYQPTAFEQERLARAAGRQSGTAASVPVDSLPSGADGSRAEHVSPRRDGLYVGTLADHGRATYHHDPRERMSYFVKIETRQGERTLWGVDLERAFKESLTQPQLGDEVGVRSFRQDPVTVQARQKDEDGEVVGETPLATHRNRWIVEQRAFFDDRSAAAQTVRDPSVAAREAVRQRPELAGTYLYLKGAEEVAQKRIRDPEDQRRFVEAVRVALAQSVARGEALPPVRLREKPAVRRGASRTARSTERERTPARGGP